MIRRAEPEDDTRIAALRRAWTEENHGGPIDDAGFESRFAEWSERERRQRITWLALEDEDAIGMLNMLVFERMPWPGQHDVAIRPDRWGYLANAYVVPAWRNRGVGGALVAACTSYADAEGFARVVLSPSERSVAFYERCGFRPATGLMVRPNAQPARISNHSGKP